MVGDADVLEFDLTAASELANRSFPSVKWIGYGVSAFLLVWGALIVAVLVEGPHPTNVCYRIFCSKVPISQFYAVWIILLVAVLAGAAAVLRSALTPLAPKITKLTVSASGLDLVGGKAGGKHVPWPAKTESMTLFDWRGLNPQGRKYCPADGNLRLENDQLYVGLSGEAVDGILAVATRLGLGIIASNEAYASLTKSLGSYAKYRISGNGAMQP